MCYLSPKSRILYTTHFVHLLKALIIYCIKYLMLNIKCHGLLKKYTYADVSILERNDIHCVCVRKCCMKIFRY